MRKSEILQAITDVPALPSASAVVIRQIRDPNVDISKLTRNIEMDQSLTTNVLRLANSALFGSPRKIGSIQEAVTRIGLQKLFQLVIASTVGPMTRRQVKGYDLPSGTLWRHSVRVALGTVRLAEILKVRVPDHAFTGALLHDIGKIVLGTFVQVDVQEVISCAFDNMISFDEAERRVLGVDHAEVGGMLLEKWSLPDELVEVVSAHHHPSNKEPDTVTDLVHMTDAYCLMSGDGLGMDGLHYHCCNEAANRLGVTSRVGEQLLAKIDEAAAEIQDLMDLAGN